MLFNVFNSSYVFFFKTKNKKSTKIPNVAQISFELANSMFYIKKIDEIIYKTS
jgi:hypothetical protein